MIILIFSAAPVFSRTSDDFLVGGFTIMFRIKATSYKNRVHSLFLLVVTGVLSGICGQNRVQSVASPAVLFELLALNRDLPTRQRPKYRSPSALVPSADGRRLYVAEQTAKRIAVVDIASRSVIAAIRLPNEVTGIAVAQNGMVYAACSSDLWPAGMVCEVDPVAGVVRRRLPAGFGARSPVIGPDGKTLYVCNQYQDDVYFIEIADGAVTGKVPVGRQPFSCAITPDGSVLAVVNHLPAGPSTDIANAAGTVVLVNTALQRVDATIALPVGSHSVSDVAVAPGGSYAYATHLVGMFTLRPTVIERGWIHTNNVAVIDIREKRLLNDFTLDDADRGAANPWKTACTGNGDHIAIVHAGSNELTVIDTRAMLRTAVEKSAVVTGEKGLQFKGCSHDFSALNGCKTRIPVAGKGPRALAITGRRIYTAGYFENDSGHNAVEVFDLASDGTATRPSGSISLGAAQPLTDARKGERVFGDGTLCRQTWQSCASCHPAARSDGLNWIFGSGSSAAPRNVKSLVYSWWTPPAGWSGRRAHASESVRFGFQNSLFVKTDEVLAGYVDNYLMRITPVSSPHLVKGKLSPRAAFGREVFHENPACDCIACHTGPLYTDGNFHRSGIPEKWEIAPIWETPAIIETWRDAPYDHVGSFDRLEDMLSHAGHSTFIANDLAKDCFTALLEFVRSL